MVARREAVVAVCVRVVVPRVVLVVSQLVVTCSSVQVGLDQDLLVEVPKKAEVAAETSVTMRAVATIRMLEATMKI